MKIAVVAVGDIKERALRDLIKEKVNSLKHHIEIIEIKEPKEAKNNRESEILTKLEKEADLILSKLKSTDYVVSLAIEGVLVSNDLLKSMFHNASTNGKQRMVFIIGGSNGISDEVKEKSNELISLSRMTFPHQLTRAILLDLLGELNG